MILDSIRGLRRAASCCGVVGAIRLGVGAAIATSCCGVCVPIRLVVGAVEPRSRQESKSNHRIDEAIGPKSKAKPVSTTTSVPTSEHILPNLPPISAPKNDAETYQN